MTESALDLAGRAAERFLREHGVTTAPVDPIAIAEALEIEVRPMPESTGGVSGMLLRRGNAFGIGYATHISNGGFQRFSVAHELGHYVLPGHLEKVLPAGEMHHSRAGFASKDRFELEADHFAAGLLMPGFLFRKAMLRAGSGFAAIQALADQFDCSLEATAIQYARLSDEPVAIVVSTGERADYWFASEVFKRLPGITWIRKRDLLPAASYTREFNKKLERVVRCERWEQTSSIVDWFGDGPDRELAEDVVGLGGYGRTLTVLFPEGDWPDEEEVDEEDPSAWEPTFHRSRPR